MDEQAGKVRFFIMALLKSLLELKLIHPADLFSVNAHKRSKCTFCRSVS